jgi:3',5'-cyclic AMP phosphodiesterase CpdA
VFTLAHVSDWHATSLLGAPARALATKRFWGWQSWHRSRRKRHLPEVLACLLDDIRQQQPDHVVVTGDLTNVALEQEFVEAADTLRGFGAPDWITVVPGNHDAYVGVDPACGWDRWAPYLCADGVAPELAPMPADYPTLRLRGELALIGLCSALPTPLFMASGRLGAPQLERLERVLHEQRGRTRVVALHHPPTDREVGWRRRLRDWAALQAVLLRAGAELVVHGHRHRSWFGTVPGPAGPIPVAGVRSSSDVGTSERRRAQYHLFRFEPGVPGAPVRLEVRGYDRERKAVVCEEERGL